jgi:hypothetical protein
VRGTLEVRLGSVTVTLPDKSTATFGVDATTIVRDNGATVATTDLVDGAPAIVVGTRNQDGSYTARLIRRVPEPTDTVTPPAGATPQANPNIPPGWVPPRPAGQYRPGLCPGLSLCPAIRGL